MSLMTDVDGENCLGLRFEEHTGTLDVAQIHFWTRLTYKAVVTCQEMAVRGKRFESPGFLEFWAMMIRDEWVREYAAKLLRVN